MLKAKYFDTHEVIDITKVKNPRQSIDKKRVVCRLCGAPLIIKAGMNRAKHFAHKNTCTSDFKRHGESPEHNLAKELISNHIKKYWSEYSDAIIEIEYIILSSITNEDLQNRTNDYESLGIDSIWWLGKNADTEYNQNWCFNRFGYSLSIDYKLLQDRVTDIYSQENKVASEQEPF